MMGRYKTKQEESSNYNSTARKEARRDVDMGGFRHVTMVNKGGFRQSLMLVQQWRRHRRRGKRNGSNYSSGRGQSLLCGVSSRGVDCVADSIADCGFG